MKLIIIKGNLKEGLSVVEKARGENSNLPILKNILIESEKNNTKLTSTNLEIAITTIVPSKILNEGRITIPADIINNLINNIPSERLNLEVKNNEFTITTDNYKANIQGMSADEFPLIPKLKNQEKYIELKGEVLKEALEQTISSAQTSDIRPELNSILFNFSLDALKVVTTDAARLSEKTIPQNQLNSNQDEEFKFLLPLKAGFELMKIIKDSDAIKIFNDPNQVLFRSERFEFISRLIDGNFPDYKSIIPTTFDSESELDREELMNALKLTGVFGSKVNEVNLKTTENKKGLIISSSDQVMGDNAYTLSVKTKGEPVDINFNWRFLMDGLKNLRSNEVFMGINENNKPTLIKANNNSAFIYVLMPILKA